MSVTVDYITPTDGTVLASNAGAGSGGNYTYMVALIDGDISGGVSATWNGNPVYVSTHAVGGGKWELRVRPFYPDGESYPYERFIGGSLHTWSISVGGQLLGPYSFQVLADQATNFIAPDPLIRGDLVSWTNGDGTAFTKVWAAAGTYGFGPPAESSPIYDGEATQSVIIGDYVYAGGTWTVWVQSLNSGGGVSPSSYLKSTINVQPSPIGKPYNLQPTGNEVIDSPDGTLLQWDDDEHPDRYRVIGDIWTADGETWISALFSRPGEFYETSVITTDKFYPLTGQYVNEIPPECAISWRVIAEYFWPEADPDYSIPYSSPASEISYFVVGNADNPSNPSPAHQETEVCPLTEWLSWKPADGMIDQRIVFDFASGTLSHQIVNQILGYTNEIDPETGRCYVNIKNILSDTQWPLYRNETFKWRVDTLFEEDGEYEIGPEWSFTTPDFPADLQPWPVHEDVDLKANIPYLSVTVPTDAKKVEFWKDSSLWAVEPIDKLSEIEITDEMRVVDELSLVSLRENWSLPAYYTWPLTGRQTDWHVRIHWNSK